MRACLLVPLVLRRARLLEVPGAGAFPHAERPEVFFPEVERFLARVTEADTVPGN
jgi:pimeloyl-ACP methyl ester carboxylesterase